MTMHAEVRRHHQKFAEKHMKRAKGSTPHADAAEDRELIRKELEDVKITPKRKKRGGKVKGAAPAERLDKRARGGSVGKKKGGVAVIVHAGGDTEGARKQGMQQGMALGAKLGARQAASQMTGHPPMGAPPPGARPPMQPGGPPAPPPGMPPQAMGGGPRPMPNGPMPGAFARGGGVEEDAGNRSGEAREMKELGRNLVPVKAHTRRKRGGACE